VLDAESHPLSRRRVLVDGGRGLLALALVGAATTACGPSKPPEPDPLEAQLQAARRDSELAAAAAKNAPRAAVPALNEIAAERGRHASALVEELSRAAGKPTPTETTASTSSTPAPSDKPGPPPGVREVAEALKKSAESATELVPTLSGYRAGLMGSIAAACTASFTVGLPAAAPAKPAPDSTAPDSTAPDSTASHLPGGSASRLPGPGPINPPDPPPASTVDPSERKPR
jgi:hypothetical protein